MESKFQPVRQHSTEEAQYGQEQEVLLESLKPGTPHYSNWFGRLRRRLPFGTGALLPLYFINIIALVMLFWTVYRGPHTSCTDPGLEGIYSPLKDEVRYKDIVFKKGFITDMSAYMGWPNDEKDTLWTDLYKYMPIQITKAEAKMLPNETEHYTVDGFEDDYMVGIDVFHQLHCLNVLRRSYYPKRYPGMSMWHLNGTLDIVNWVHIDHCIESLRQSLMCTSDISPMSMSWLSDRKYMMLGMKTYHRCRDFDGLRNWAMTRFRGEYSTRRHVEDGHVVDYEGYGNVVGDLDPEEMRKARLDLPEEIRAGFGG